MTEKIIITLSLKPIEALLEIETELHALIRIFAKRQTLEVDHKLLASVIDSSAYISTRLKVFEKSIQAIQNLPKGVKNE